MPKPTQRNGLLHPFADKLEIVLKALALSRGRLAAELAVDKSVISRWLRGRNGPTGENLAQLTRLVAARHPGFTGLDWDRAPDDLRVLLAPTATKPFLAGAGDTDPAVFAGFWHAWRITFTDRDTVARDVVRLTPNGNVLDFVQINPPQRIEGAFWARGEKAGMRFDLSFFDSSGFALFHILPARRLEVIDGFALTVTAHLSRMVTAVPMVWIRYCDLTGNAAADDRLLAALGAEEGMFDRATLDPVLDARLTARLSDNGVYLHLPADQTLARVSTPRDIACAAERTAHFLATGALLA